MKDFATRLCDAIDSVSSPVVVGLDPTPEALPAVIRSKIEEKPDLEHLLAGTRSFLRGVLEVCRPSSAVTKIQSAFFECMGWKGFALLYEMVAYARELGYVVILDAKRNDIGHTAGAYVRTFLEEHSPLGCELELPRADAMTVTPIFGDDGNEPFLKSTQDGCGLFFIVRTSNPSSAQLQGLELRDGRRVDQAIADLVASYAERYGTEGSRWSPIGAVVGATQSELLLELRERMPRCFLLMPGVGAQGAALEPLARAFDERGHGALIPISRGLLKAHLAQGAPADWKAAVADAASHYAQNLRQFLAR